MHAPSARPGIGGFTLIELLTVIAISAITLTLGVPTFSDTMRRSRTTSSVNQLSASFAAARMAAVNRNRPVVVCPLATDGGCRKDGQWEGGWIVFVERTHLGHPDAADILQRIDAPAPGQLHIRSGSGRARLRYLPDGRSAGTNMTVRVCRADDARLLASVIVNNVGRVRSERPANAAATCV